MGNDHMLVVALLKIGALGVALLPIFFIIKVIMATEKTLGQLGSNMLNGVQRAGNRGANLATRAAKNSAPGQAMQEYMNTRKASSKIRGQEMYRKIGNKIPALNYSKTQRQLFDAQNMKNYQEEVSRARGMTSLNVARAFGNVGSNNSVDPSTGRRRYDPNAGLSGANLEQVRRDQGYWHHDPTSGKSSFIAFTQEDMNSLQRLDTAGFLGGSENRAGATAAMDELFDQNFVEKRDIENLARTAGTDAQSSALMTESVRSAAGRNKYKNFQYGHVQSGNYSQTVTSAGTKDGLSIVESGTEGVPKEVYEDASIQAGIAHKVRQAALSGGPALRQAVTDIARQTRDVNKPAIINAIASASGMSDADFGALRQAIQTNTLASSTEAAAALKNVESTFAGNINASFTKTPVIRAAKEIRKKRVNAYNNDTGSKKASDDAAESAYIDTL